MALQYQDIRKTISDYQHPEDLFKSALKNVLSIIDEDIIGVIPSLHRNDDGEYAKRLSSASLITENYFVYIPMPSGHQASIPRFSIQPLIPIIISVGQVEHQYSLPYKYDTHNPMQQPNYAKIPAISIGIEFKKNSFSLYYHGDDLEKWQSHVFELIPFRLLVS